MGTTTSTASQPHPCQRCGRKLTATAEPYGRTCQRKIREAAKAKALDGLTVKQAAEATEIVADGGVVPSAHKGVWLVTSGDGSQVYRVTADGHCNCKWGMRNLPAHPCKHVGAVKLLQVPAKAAPARVAPVIPLPVPAPRPAGDIWDRLAAVGATGTEDFIPAF